MFSIFLVHLDETSIVQNSFDPLIRITGIKSPFLIHFPKSFPEQVQKAVENVSYIEIDSFYIVVVQPMYGFTKEIVKFILEYAGLSFNCLKFFLPAIF